MSDDEKWLIELIVSNTPQYILAWAACKALENQIAPNKSDNNHEEGK